MIVGTAGHVDHGKTSLVRRLTGVDTDRLKEEKARGITIELGFAFMEGAGGETIGFVDVPGHERFVRTMVAGAAGIDFALLVVAADEGVMPQTREHLEILDLLGIARGAVAVSKCDRADSGRRAEVAGSMMSALAGTTLARAPLLFVSARSGAGLEALRDHLATASRDRQAPDDSGFFRMPVDRVFSLKGVGTVVTGTSLCGRVGVDDTVVVMPGARKARVRSLHVQNRDAEEACAGQRCALALQGAAIDRYSVARGSWICADPDPVVTSRFDADVRVLAREKRTLASGMPIHLHCGASHVCGRIVALETDGLRPGSTGLAQITIENALPLCHGDSFVLRDQSARRTVGGGTILDIAPLRRERREVRLQRLAAQRPRDKFLALARLLELEPNFVDLTTFGRQRGMRSEELAALRTALGLETLRAGSSLFACRPARKAEIAAAIIATLTAFHREHPDLPGMPVDRLREGVAPALPKALFAGLCDDILASRTIAATGHWLRLPTFAPAIPEADERLFLALRPLIEQSCFQPPRVRDMGSALSVEEEVVRRVCKTYARAGELVEIGRDRFFLSASVDDMLAVARSLSEGGGLFQASAFRDRLGNGRKVAIEILEAFDRRGLTLRDGEWRRAAEPKRSHADRLSAEA